MMETAKRHVVGNFREFVKHWPRCRAVDGEERERHARAKRKEKKRKYFYPRSCQTIVTKGLTGMTVI